MKKVVEKDKLKRYLFKKYESQRLALKVLQRLGFATELIDSVVETTGLKESVKASVGQRTRAEVAPRGRTFTGSLTRYAGIALARLPRNSSKSRIRNRCILTGRGNSVYRAFRISRIELRKCALGSSGGSLYSLKLPYVNKASW
jgi:small subunit ribosomal protein S14